MKTLPPSAAGSQISEFSQGVFKCLEPAHGDAVRNAILHKVPLAYLKDGKLLLERPWLKSRRKADAPKPSSPAARKRSPRPASAV